MPRVAVAGNLSRDIVDGGPPRPGGCPVFAVQAFRLLGREGVIVTRCADADAPFFRPALAAAGASVAWLAAATTSGFALSYTGEERELGVTSLGETWRPQDARSLPGDVEWVHAAPLVRSDFPAPALAALAAGRRLSFDGQGLVRVPALGPLRLDAAYDPELLASVTALKLSEQEARVLARGAFGPADARRLGVPEVLLTLGSRGAVVYARGRETPVPPARLVRGVETTGAGDAFMVAYAAARVDGRSPVEAAQAASQLVAGLLEERLARAG
ncbi:MAG TPA: PfkB family carbohydrate kinase [Gaiellaceae bacterium]|nr:PfkB family carbohydrate kinase [Gaiellaceae bacterium]